MEDKYCNSDGFRKVIEMMINHMKTPEENLIPFLLTLTDFIEKSGNFKWKSARGEIVSRNVIGLLNGDSYYVSIGRQGRLNLSCVFNNIDSCNLWNYLEYAGSNDSFYTENKIALLMFLDNLIVGNSYTYYKRPSYAFIELLSKIDNNSSYYEALANSGLLINNYDFVAETLTGYFDYDLGNLGNVPIRSRGILSAALEYTNFIQTTGYNILRGMGNRIEGVADDISIYATIYQASISQPNSQIHQFTRRVLLARQEDWVELMRREGEGNPEAIVQEAEEYEASKEESLNIDDKKMEEYIRLILGGKENAQSNVS